MKHFFHLNFLNAQGILAQKCIMHVLFFCQFSDVKDGGQSQQLSVLSQLVTGEPQRTGLSHPKKS